MGTFWHRADAFCHSDGEGLSPPRLQKNFIMLKFDATRIGDEDVKNVLRKYGVLGLPAVVFLQYTGYALRELTVSGIMEPEDFLQHLNQVETKTEL